VIDHHLGWYACHRSSLLTGDHGVAPFPKSRSSLSSADKPSRK
jgi:hypothetical protein